MFVLDGELDPIHEFAMTQPAVWSDLYFGAAIVVYLASPLLTFSVVLSFFKNLSAMWRYAFRRCTELYVFSELNEDSLYLAGSIKAAHPKGLIVFTDVYASRQTSPCCGCGALTAPARSTSSCWAGTRQRTSIRRCC